MASAALPFLPSLTRQDLGQPGEGGVLVEGRDAGQGLAGLDEGDRLLAELDRGRSVGEDGRRREQLVAADVEGEGVEDVEVLGVGGEDLAAHRDHVRGPLLLDRGVERGHLGRAVPLRDELGVLALRVLLEVGLGRRHRLGVVARLAGVVPGAVGRAFVLDDLLRHGGRGGDEGEGGGGDERDGRESLAKMHVQPPDRLCGVRQIGCQV